MCRDAEGRLAADDAAGPFEPVERVFRRPDADRGEVLTRYEGDGFDHEGVHREIAALIGRIPGLDFEFVNAPPEGAIVAVEEVCA